MLKILASLVVLASASAYAAQPPLSLESVGLETILATRVPAPSGEVVAVPWRAAPPPADRYFSQYILKAVHRLYADYGLLGYDINSILTHDIQYHTFGIIPARRAPLTMCVAAVMEVILTAYDIYAKETGDYSVYEYLPKKSFEGLNITDIKGHIWVNTKFNANGTADALINFGMGERTVFERLKPGAFVNINRTTKTGHAVVFMNYIDAAGAEQAEYNDTVVGFRYFSSQGRLAAGEGGFDYRYAVFSNFGCPVMPYKRDCNVIYSADQRMLNTGTMTSPAYWTHVTPAEDPAAGEAVLNRSLFNGVTTDD